MTARPLALAVVLGSLALACASPTEPEIVVSPITIESVDVRVLESSPPQATAHVEGVIGDGCTELQGTTQSRAGNVVTITIEAARPRDAICTQIARLYREDIRLEGQFPPGHYVLRVNGVEKPFDTQ
jgi:hypothetical protein